MSALIWKLIPRTHQTLLPVFTSQWICVCIYVCKRGLAKLCGNKEFTFSWQPCEVQLWLLNRSRASHNRVELPFSARPHILESLTPARRKNLLTLLSICFQSPRATVRTHGDPPQPLLTAQHSRHCSWWTALCHTLVQVYVLSCARCTSCVSHQSWSLEGNYV